MTNINTAEQQKFAALFEKLPPDKKKIFSLIMQTFANMVVTLAEVENEQKPEN